ncbi:MAG: MBL fold metallo-hydrolase [Flavobacterium sp.]|nr:MBL fold metallo-hydrolase [Flavobacterium sp.]
MIISFKHFCVHPFFIFVNVIITSTSFAQNIKTTINTPATFLLVLGNTQDAGYPQIGCTNDCCKAYWQHQQSKKLITSLALIDKTTNQYWLFEATPDIAEQLQLVQHYTTKSTAFQPTGIFISHAHIGHYTGLMQLGREAFGAKNIPVFAMPRLHQYLQNNGPWSQLVSLNNIHLQSIQADESLTLNGSMSVTPLLVPHRDEYSETVGFVITTCNKKVLFIPDIDKWEKWNKSIVAEIAKVDIALIDGTFYANGELPGRDMKEIPHPFVVESMALFGSLPQKEKDKIYFIHFNHTNPLLNPKSKQQQNLLQKGFKVANQGLVIGL